MTKIKFGTDGWRAIIAKDFTVANVERVAEATAQWLLNKPSSLVPRPSSPSVVVGHDCRFGGKLFAETVAKVLAAQGIKVFLATDFISTPMISLGTVKLKTDLGVIITASHNPPDYNGFKLKGHYGGPLLPAMVEEIENLIHEKSTINSENISLEEFKKKGLVEDVDLETMYCKHVEANFDLTAIRNSKLRLGYDAMFGAGQNVIKRILPEAVLLHCEQNPSFKGIPPEPILKNLHEFSELIRTSGTIDCGLVTDGDADRIGLFDNKGNFVDSHHIILLLIHYLNKYKGMTGKVVVAFSCTPRINSLSDKYKLPNQVVKIGFKYVCEIMLHEDVLLGGEESGGIAIKGHIPERDGIWIGLTLFEYMAKSGKTLRELIQEVYAEVGEFAFERFDWHITEAQKQKIVINCKNGKYAAFGKYKVTRTQTIDGYKYYFENGDWLMIRASGTEPVLRLYAESSTKEAAFDILKTTQEMLLA